MPKQIADPVTVPGRAWQSRQIMDKFYRDSSDLLEEVPALLPQWLPHQRYHSAMSQRVGRQAIAIALSYNGPYDSLTLKRALAERGAPKMIVGWRQRSFKITGLRAFCAY